MLRRLLILPLAIVLLAACSGDDGDADVLGVAVERSTTTTTESRATSSTTEARPTTTSATAAPTTATTAAPVTTTRPPAAPPTTAPPPAPTTTAAPATTTTPPTTTAPTTQAVTGRYTSPDGNGAITVELQDGAGATVASQRTGPSGGDFSFAVAPGTYRIQITDVGPGASENRTSGTVITRTESFTLEAGRSARFECHVRTGCSGGVR